jgi:hypothetical protein
MSIHLFETISNVSIHFSSLAKADLNSNNPAEKDLIFENFRIKEVAYFDRKVVNENNKPLVLCLRYFAFISSLVNIRIFSTFKLKNSLYKLLMIIAIADALYSFMLLSLGFLAMICYEDSLCGPSLYYGYLLGYVFISEFLTSSLALFNIILEIFITIQRILILSQVNSLLKTAKVRVVCSIFSVVSIIAYSPLLSMFKIVKIDQDDAYESANNTSFEYRLSKNEFGKSTAALFFLTSISLTRITLVTVFLFVLNITCIVKFKQYLKKKIYLKKIKGEHFLIYIKNTILLIKFILLTLN